MSHQAITAERNGLASFRNDDGGGGVHTEEDVDTERNGLAFFDMLMEEEEEEFTQKKASTENVSHQAIIAKRNGRATFRHADGGGGFQREARISCLGIRLNLEHRVASFCKLCRKACKTSRLSAGSCQELVASSAEVLRSLCIDSTCGTSPGPRDLLDSFHAALSVQTHCGNLHNRHQKTKRHSAPPDIVDSHRTS